MAGTADHGEVLTKFEEIFGALVEHEVIKMVLQGCEWETSKASETLLGMIDENDLPPHILQAVLAGNVVTTLPKPCEDEQEPQGEIGPDDIAQSELSSQDTLLNDLNCSVTNGSTVETHGVLTPLAWAPGTLASEEIVKNLKKQESGSPSVRPKVRREREVESDVSSPSNSPLRINTVSQGSENSCIKDTSQWVLAPEFVPNAFSQNAYNGIWPLKVNKTPAQPQTGAKERSPVKSKAVKEQSPAQSKISKKEDIINKIVRGEKIMVLMRGLPGSGKTTLANIIKGRSGIILSTDDFFCDDQGVYRYDPHRLSEAHGWNKHRALLKVQEGWSPIIIDNTNVQAWEMKPYIKMALHHGYEVDVLEPETPWKFTPKELTKKSIHGVPKHRISEMKEHYDKEIVILNMIANLKSAHPNNVGKKSSEEDNDTQKINKIVQSEVKQHKKKDQVVHQAHKRKDLGDEALDDDPDVVVEGYEELEDIAHKSRNCSPVKITKCSNVEVDELEAQNALNKKEVEIPITDKEDVLNEPEVYESDESDIADEDRIKQLIEEANVEVDNVEHDWDDLALQASCEEEVDDTKFNDLVSSFGSAMKQQLEKISQVSGSETTLHALDEEDSAMYEFCCSVEEKLGKPLSTLVRPGKSEAYSTLLSSQSGEISPSTKEDSQDTSLFSMISMSEVLPRVENAEPFLNNELKCTKDKEDNTVSEKACEVEVGHTYQQDKIKTDKGFENKHYNQNLPLENDSSDIHVDVINEIEGLSELENREDSSEQERSQSCTLSPESTHTVQTPGSDTTTVGESFTSWECVDPDAGVSSISWEAQKGKSSDSDEQSSKPCRNRRKRLTGDPLKWLKEETSSSNATGEPSDLAWEPIQGGVSSWDTDERVTKNKEPGRRAGKMHDNYAPQPHTGAVPKRRRHQKHTRTASGTSNSSSQSDEQGGRERESPITISESQSVSHSVNYTDNETQTLSIDFEALQLDNNLYELKVMYGQPDYKPKCTDTMPESGPLTKGKLRLDKGTMTDEISDVVVVKPLQNLMAFFPNIREEDLRDVLQKCKYDLDWAMNVLLDGGYEMSDNVDIDMSQEDIEADIDTESAIETASTGDGKDDRSSFADCSDVSDILIEDRSRKIRQSQDPSALSTKKEIEATFAVSDTVDDRVKRLTGKEYNELNTNKVKQAKGKKKHGNKKEKSGKIDSISDSSNSDNVGAQYVTLVMDPLFASQLTSMFGSVGSCLLSGDLSQEDRSVILPLELCHQIHKYWADTLDGKFTQEAEVLDSLIREDENLARRLQEEEDAGTSSSIDPVCAFKLDPPTSLREIMDLEQALQESQDGDTTTGDPSLSSRLNLQRLYAEYPHVDPEALKEEFVRSGYNYRDTVERLCNRYGAEQGAPKTVIAPEALYRYEQQMILQAQKESLAEEEQANEEVVEEIQPDDPQVYRDEAQMHYHQRQEAFQKAQEASRQGMKAVAAYYARIGNLHAKKFIEANDRASRKILEAVNAKKKDANTLDLHLLHVNEALSATQAFLKERHRILTSTRGADQMCVQLITGRGKNSIGGHARLKPAIKDFLKNNKYLFHEANSGMFVVTLRK